MEKIRSIIQCFATYIVTVILQTNNWHVKKNTHHAYINKF